VAAAALAVSSSLGGAPRSPAGGQAAGQPARASLPPVAVLLVAPVHRPGAGLLKHLEVRATATGRTLATIRPPQPANSFCDITGSFRYGSFVAVACQVKTTLGGKATVTMTPRGYVAFQVSPSGQVTGQRALPVPVPRGLDYVALSPDGRTLAAATVDRSGQWPRDPAIALYSTASGRLLHRWTWPGTADIADRSYSAGVLSWTADGRTLAFPLAPGHRSGVQARLLDTTAPDGSLRRASRVAVNFGPVPVQVSVVGTLGNTDTMITPDGRLIVSGTNPPSDRPGTTGLAFEEFPATSGGQPGAARPVRTLDPVTAGGQFVLYREVLWSSTDGSVLIATGFRRGETKLSGSTVIGVVTGDGFRPLPGSMTGVFQIAF
jgi:hypothetical protein